MADDTIFFFDEDSGNVRFSTHEMGIHTVNLDNINFNDYNFKEDHPETIIQVSLLALCSKFEKSKTFKKKQKLMLVAKHPTRW